MTLATAKFKDRPRYWIIAGQTENGRYRLMMEIRDRKIWKEVA